MNSEVIILIIHRAIFQLFFHVYIHTQLKARIHLAPATLAWLMILLFQRETNANPLYRLIAAIPITFNIITNSTFKFSILKKTVLNPGYVSGIELNTGAIALAKIDSIPALSAALSLGRVADIKQITTEISIIAETTPVKEKFKVVCWCIPGEPNLTQRNQSTFVWINLSKA